MIGSSLVIFCTFAIFLALGQVPVPKRPLGYTYNEGTPTSPVQIEFYIDILCPDSRTAFPVLLEVADHYGPTVRLIAIPFPLPYHRNAWLAAKGIHVVKNLTDSDMNKIYDWMKAVFAQMDKFGEDVNLLVPETTTVQMFSDIAVTMGLEGDKFSDMLVNARQLDLDTRVEWKYACTRGIAGTPWFTVNGVIVEADQTWTVDDWKNLIDPLLGSASVGSRPITHGQYCRNGTVRCEYLPQKVECCLPGENCVPNVGCRC